MNIDWKRKLTSRKFWAAIVGFITPVLLAFGVAESVVTQTAAIIMAGASLIAYIIGEGLVDAAGRDVSTAAKDGWMVSHTYIPITPDEEDDPPYNTDGEGL